MSREQQPCLRIAVLWLAQLFNSLKKLLCNDTLNFIFKRRRGVVLAITSKAVTAFLLTGLLLERYLAQIYNIF